MDQQPIVVKDLSRKDVLKTNRSVLKLILLSLVTCGIYGIITLTSVSKDINQIAGRYDNKKTMHFCLLIFIITPVTLGIGSLVWYHRLSKRIGEELKRRNIAFSFGAKTFWLWSILGSFILVGPIIYMHKLLTAMNKLSEDYNTNKM